MRPSFSVFCLLLAATSADSNAQQVLPLWGDNEAPYARPHSIEEYQDDDCWGDVSCIHQVVTPTLTLYLPESEAAVLKYRLPNPETSTKPWRVPEVDVRQALKMLRQRQSHFGFSAAKFGVLGFSAGGHLAASVSVHRSVEPQENPDFSILAYGVSIMNAANREWLEQTLYHRPMTDAEVAYQTLLEHMDANTPPAFLVCTRVAATALAPVARKMAPASG
jgi:hypothetical protein